MAVVRTYRICLGWLSFLVVDPLACFFSFALSTFNGLFGICPSFVLSPFQLHGVVDDRRNYRIYRLY